MTEERIAELRKRAANRFLMHGWALEMSEAKEILDALEESKRETEYLKARLRRELETSIAARSSKPTEPGR